MAEKQTVFEFAYPRKEIEALLRKIDTPDQSSFQIRAVHELKFWLKNPDCFEPDNYRFIKQVFGGGRNGRNLQNK